MITAFNDTEATLKAIRLGALDYLYKPIDLDALDLLVGKNDGPEKPAGTTVASYATSFPSHINPIRSSAEARRPSR